VKQLYFTRAFSLLGIVYFLICAPNGVAAQKPTVLKAALPQSQVNSGASSTINLDKSTGTVEFKAVGKPGIIKINGVGANSTGTIVFRGEKVSGVQSFKMDTLVTGISLRDKHMKEKYLETEKYPDAHLKMTRLEAPIELIGKDGTRDSIPFEGLLSLHGVEKPIQGVAKWKTQGASSGTPQVDLTCSFDIKITDFKINVPTFAGITVTDKVSVTVHALAPLEFSQL